MTTISNESPTFEVRRPRSWVREQLETEYLQLRTVDRPALLRRLQFAIEGPESEVLERELARTEERIRTVHDQLGVIHDRLPGAGAVQVETIGVQQTLAELDRSTALQLLGDVRFGRLAFCVHGTPHVEVVNFALVDGDPIFRIGASSKLSAALSGRQLALQADRIDERTHTGWAVTVAGPVHLVAREDGERLAAGLAPWAAGERPFVMKMKVRQVCGRRLLASGGPH